MRRRVVPACANTEAYAALNEEPIEIATETSSLLSKIATDKPLQP
ncbi:MAG: hypothetical protein NWE96_03750 [Candidatus Bathyarchaeota archaeon]|nr:hypothetical protein [Candidatus Bathyarchaeota archaeon]